MTAHATIQSPQTARFRYGAKKGPLCGDFRPLSPRILVSGGVRAFEWRFLALRLCIQKFRSRRPWFPGRSHGVLLDVSDEDTIASTVDQVQREVGLVDVLVNNAGYGHEGLAEESSLEDHRSRIPDAGRDAARGRKGREVRHDGRDYPSDRADGLPPE